MAFALWKPVKKSLSIAKQYPLYLGRWLRPDSPACMMLYFHLVRLFRFRDVQDRRQEIRNLPRTENIEIKHLFGYLKLEIPDDELVKNCVSEGIKLLEERISSCENDRKKLFLWTFPLTLEEIVDTPIGKLITSPTILYPVSQYLGGIPIIGDVAVWHSPNTNFEGRSQKFHFDSEDIRQVKCFILLNDVGADNGPFTLISANSSKKLFVRLCKKKKHKWRNVKFEDTDVFEHFDKNQRISLTGPPGTVGFVDTTNCLHYGSRPGTGPRQMLMVQFLTTASAELPILRKNSFSDSHSKTFSNKIEKLLFEHTDITFQRLRSINMKKQRSHPVS